MYWILGGSQEVISGLNLIGTVFFEGRGQNVPQIGVLNWVGPQQVRAGLNMIGTAFLEVW